MNINEKIKEIQAAFVARYKKHGLDEDGHCEMCNELCDEFGLTVDDVAFPMWLSRLVDGWMRDADELGIDNLEL